MGTVDVGIADVGTVDVGPNVGTEGFVGLDVAGENKYRSTSSTLLELCPLYLP